MNQVTDCDVKGGVNMIGEWMDRWELLVCSEIIWKKGSAGMCSGCDGCGGRHCQGT
jgi:hypothetical protein